MATWPVRSNNSQTMGILPTSLSCIERRQLVKQVRTLRAPKPLCLDSQQLKGVPSENALDHGFVQTWQRSALEHAVQISDAGDACRNRDEGLVRTTTNEINLSRWRRADVPRVNRPLPAARLSLSKPGSFSLGGQRS